MFQRKQQENGSYSTRCLYCAGMVATDAESETDLARQEANHICPQRAWSELRKHQEQVAASEAPVQ